MLNPAMRLLKDGRTSYENWISSLYTCHWRRLGSVSERKITCRSTSDRFASALNNGIRYGEMISVSRTSRRLIAHTPDRFAPDFPPAVRESTGRELCLVPLDRGCAACFRHAAASLVRAPVPSHCP